MAKLRLNLQRMTVAEKIAKAQQVATALTNNAAFTHPSPELPIVTGATTDLQTAVNETLAARQTAKEKTSIQAQKEEALDKLLVQLAAYVESVAGDDEQMILSAGFDVRAPASPVTSPPSQPEGLSATASDHDGEIDLTWDSVAGAKSYIVEKSADPPAPNSWAYEGVTTRSAYTAKTLNSGTRYWFRVAAINVIGQSGWSDPAMKIAP